MIARSLVYSLALAATYGVVAAAYIAVSSSLAADHSASVEELRRIETLKGELYVAITTVAVFVGGWLAMRRMERDAEELLRRERALVASQGRVFAGVMAASIAHDANNVLTAVLADLDGLAAVLPPTAAQATAPLAQLRASVGRLVALNRRLLTAHKPSASHEVAEVDLARVMRDCAASVRSHKSLFGCRVVCRGAETLPCRTQPLLIHQIVTNLLINAGEATAGRGSLEIRLVEGRGEVSIEVHDDGKGVPTGRRDGLFESLHSTKRDGSGLGLFSVRACAQALGGRVEVADSPLGGACFRVCLPLQPAAAVVAG
jgi:two-component system C4-dicarboxylate transport sensor histidine kinase DctB